MPQNCNVMTTRHLQSVGLHLAPLAKTGIVVIGDVKGTVRHTFPIDVIELLHAQLNCQK